MSLLQSYYEMLRVQLTELSFLLIVLPLCLFAYYIIPARLRPAMLLAQSLWLYPRAQAEGLGLMIFSVLADYLAVQLMERFDAMPNRRQACLWFSVVKGVALILGYGVMARTGGLPHLTGLHIYTLLGMSSVVGVYRRKIPAERNVVYFALYCCFYPRLFAGPLQSCEGFTRQLRGVALRPQELLVGVGTFLEGAFKTAVLGGSLYTLYLSAGGVREASMLSAWMQVFAFAAALYFMLSGLCDMAQGIGRMYGLTLPRNYYYPYQSRNVQDFFDRFNFTVNDFLKDTVYQGLQGDKNGPLADSLNILVTCMLCGLWFGLRLNYLVWGVYLAVFIIMERYLYPKLLTAVPVLFCRIGTLCVVLAGFTIFLADSAAQSAALVRGMFDFGHIYNEQALYLLTSNWLLLLASAVLATNAVNLLGTKLRRAAPVAGGAVTGVVDLAILVLYIALTLQ